MEIRYVDYGGYDRVKIDALRQIRRVPPGRLWAVLCSLASGLDLDGVSRFRFI